MTQSPNSVIRAGPIWRLALIAFLALFPLPARADFAEGLAAYDAGDFATTFQVWTRLAEEGNIEAQTALAGLYASGNGGFVDLQLAQHWYQIAARAGSPVAQMNLGEFYRQGLGVEQNLVEAFAWLFIAGRAGRAWAARTAEDLFNSLTQEDRAAAHARLSDLQSSLRQ